MELFQESTDPKQLAQNVPNGSYMKLLFQQFRAYQNYGAIVKASDGVFFARLMSIFTLTLPLLKIPNFQCHCRLVNVIVGEMASPGYTVEGALSCLLKELFIERVATTCNKAIFGQNKNPQECT